jgi:hypothetical protein
MKIYQKVIFAAHRISSPTTRAQVNDLIVSGFHNAADTVYLERALPLEDFDYVFCASLESLLSEDHIPARVRAFFASVGVTA